MPSKLLSTGKCAVDDPVQDQRVHERRQHKQSHLVAVEIRIIPPDCVQTRATKCNALRNVLIQRAEKDDGQESPNDVPAGAKP